MSRSHHVGDPRWQLLGRAELAAPAGWAILCFPTPPEAILCISHTWERESKAHSTSHMEIKHKGHLARSEAYLWGQSPGKISRSMSPGVLHQKSLSTSTPIPTNEVMSLLVVVVGFGSSVPLGGKACANRKLTQSRRSEQECSILDLKENKSKR